MYRHFTVLSFTCLGALACGGGAPSGGRAAAAGGALAAELQIVSGDGQIAAPGGRLPLEPVVRAVDSAGAPVQGVAVRFEVTLGGGAVAAREGLTDAAGLASAGGWSLGPAPGGHRLVASDGVGHESNFTALALRSSPELSVTITSPAPGALVRYQMPVEAEVRGAAAVTAVAATNCLESVLLTEQRQKACGPGCSTWSGSLCNDRAPAGLIPVMVTAADRAGHVVDAGVLVRLDRPPVLAITAPVLGTVVGGLVDVVATCDDDREPGCVRLDVTDERGVVLLTGTRSVQGRLDLSSLEGTDTVLRFAATDAGGQQTEVLREVMVESSPHLALVHRIAGTQVVDHAGDRMLTIDRPYGARTLRLHDFAAGTVEPVVRLHGMGETDAFLWSRGVVYVGDDAHGWAWSDGERVDLGQLDQRPLQVAGDYVLFTKGSERVRRDLVAGTEIVIPDAQRDVLAPDGDVLFVNGSTSLHAWREAGDELIQPGPPEPSTRFVQLATDGDVIAWVSVTSGAGSQLHILRQGVVTDHDGVTEPFVESGWVAFRGADGGRIHRLGPEGREWVSEVPAQVEPLALEAMSPEGALVYSTPTDRYLVGPGKAPVRVSGRHPSGHDEVCYRDGAFYLVLGSSVFRIVP